MAYLAFPCISGILVVRELVGAANGRLVVPVRWHCSTTSLNTTNHISFFPGLPNTSLSRLNELFPLTPPGVGDDALSGGPCSDGGHCFSSTNTLDGFGRANCRTLSSPSILAKTSLVLSLSSFCIFSSSILLTIASTSATICRVLSYSNVLGSVWNSRFWKRRGYFSSLWKGFESVIARPVSPFSLEFSSSFWRNLHTLFQSATSWFFGFLFDTLDRALSTCPRARSRCRT